jgi:hypothetical protein
MTSWLFVRRTGVPVWRADSASKGCTSMYVETSIAEKAMRVPSRDVAGCRSAPRPIVSGCGGPDRAPAAVSKGIVHSDRFFPTSPFE